MGKRFAEVIPGLKVSEELQGFLDVMTVDRVTATKDRSKIRFFISAEH